MQRANQEEKVGKTIVGGVLKEASYHNQGSSTATMASGSFQTVVVVMLLLTRSGNRMLSTYLCNGTASFLYS
jgi:hypothetical protein